MSRQQSAADCVSHWSVLQSFISPSLASQRQTASVIGRPSSSSCKSAVSGRLRQSLVGRHPAAASQQSAAGCVSHWSAVILQLPVSSQRQTASVTGRPSSSSCQSAVSGRLRQSLVGRHPTAASQQSAADCVSHWSVVILQLPVSSQQQAASVTGRSSSYSCQSAVSGRLRQSLVGRHPPAASQQSAAGCVRHQQPAAAVSKRLVARAELWPGGERVGRSMPVLCRPALFPTAICIRLHTVRRDRPNPRRPPRAASCSGRVSSCPAMSSPRAWRSEESNTITELGLALDPAIRECV